MLSFQATFTELSLLEMQWVVQGTHTTSALGCCTLGQGIFSASSDPENPGLPCILRSQIILEVIWKSAQSNHHHHKHPPTNWQMHINSIHCANHVHTVKIFEDDNVACLVASINV